MRCFTFKPRAILAILAMVGVVGDVASASAPTYIYHRLGNAEDIKTDTMRGVALIGGGPDLRDAVRWMCARAGGGDFLVLGAESDDLSTNVSKACETNSVAYLVIPSKEAANDPFVSARIREAAAVLIDGGEQEDYVKYWSGTAVQSALDDAVKAGVPVGGISAGMAILGEFAFPAFAGSAQSPESLRDPYNPKVMIVSDVVSVPGLAHTITDTHLVARDRMGRLVSFLARILQDGLSPDVRGIGVDENSSVLIEADGTSKVVGSGRGAYFLRPSEHPKVCKPERPLTFMKIGVYQVSNGGSFKLSTWKGEGGRAYELSVAQGTLRSSNPY